MDGQGANGADGAFQAPAERALVIVPVLRAAGGGAPDRDSAARVEEAGYAVTATAPA